MKTTALMFDAIREIYSRKVILGLVVIELIVLIITAIVLYQPGMQAEYAEARDGRQLPGEWGEPAPDTVTAPPLDAADSLLLLGGRTDSSTTPLTAPTDTGGSDVFDQERPASTAPSGSTRSSLLTEKVRGQLAVFATPILPAVLFLGLFVTAATVPAMMERGTIELLLSKPVTRHQVLLGRALGGVMAVAVNLILFVLALFLLYGLATGAWIWSFVPAAITLPLLAFVAVYSGVVLLSVVTESWMLPLSISYLHLMILGPFLQSREMTLYTWIDSGIVRPLIDGLYWILPQTTDLTAMTSSLVFTGGVTTIAPILQAVAFTLVCWFGAVFLFRRKDF